VLASGQYDGVDETAADPKAGEREYYRRIGAAGRDHARLKPFADDRCGHYLSDAGALLFLLEPPPGRILEFGCGTGWLSRFLARAGYEVTGVDISPEAIALAREAAEVEAVARVRFEVGDYEEAATGDYDAVLFYDALHHAEAEARAVAAAYAALRPGGMMVAFEPGEGHGSSASSRQAVADYAVHEKDMPPRRIIELGRAAGFSRHVVLPSPHELNRTVYRRDFHQHQGALSLWGEKAWGYLRAMQKLATQRRGGLTALWK
jgi:SAM-dependent methyltransferase